MSSEKPSFPADSKEPAPGAAPLRPPSRSCVRILSILLVTSLGLGCEAARTSSHPARSPRPPEVEPEKLAPDQGPFPKPGEPVEYALEPELRSMREPVYPDTAREKGVQGTVLIRVLVGRDGLVKDTIVIQSVPMLDEAATRAANTAVFRPAKRKDGKPVAVWMVIPIEYKLHTGPR